MAEHGGPGGKACPDRKPIVIGLYLHNYRGCLGPTEDNAVDLDESHADGHAPGPATQDDRLLRKGKIEGFILLQNGWLDYETHRPQMQWTKDYLDWLFQTQTIRKPSQEKN